MRPKQSMVAGALLALCCGGIGFLDDYIKVVKKRNLGLTSLQKLFAQLLVGARIRGVGLHGGGHGGVGAVSRLGGFRNLVHPLCRFCDRRRHERGQPDRRDRRPVRLGQPDRLPVLPHRQRAVRRTGPHRPAALAGAVAGFLLWNLHPAKVFMGDTGSLFLGGALAALAFGTTSLSCSYRWGSSTSPRPCR